MVRKKEQNRYIIFVSIPRLKPAESSGSLDGFEYYYDNIAIFDTENKEKAQTIAELLTKDYEGGSGEDLPEGFIFKSEAEMVLEERIRAHDQCLCPRYAVEKLLILWSAPATIIRKSVIRQFIRGRLDRLLFGTVIKMILEHSPAGSGLNLEISCHANEILF